MVSIYPFCTCTGRSVSHMPPLQGDGKLVYQIYQGYHTISNIKSYLNRMMNKPGIPCKVIAFFEGGGAVKKKPFRMTRRYLNMEEQGEWQTLMGKSWEWMQIAKNGCKG